MKNKKNLFNSSYPFKLSRSKLELFINCPRCFYLDRKLGIRQPDSYPYTLNNAVDELLKREFDWYRSSQKPHPLFLEHNLDILPFKHDDLNSWRDSLHKGIKYPMPNTNITVSGGVDDIWVNINTQELIVVDYKATAKQGIISIDEGWQLGYKRQVEVYQWLFRKNGFKVSDTAYFLYCNGNKNAEYSGLTQ